MRGNAHGDEDDEEIDPDTCVGKEPEFLQRADLAQRGADNGPDQTAHGIAEVELRDFGQGLAVADDNQTDLECQLETLHDVEKVAQRSAVEAVGNVAVVLDGELVAVEAHEALPDEPARDTGQEAEDGEEGDTRAEVDH